MLPAALFAGYALGHPEASFPFGNRMAYGLYLAYGFAVIAMFRLWRKTGK